MDECLKAMKNGFFKWSTAELKCMLIPISAFAGVALCIHLIVFFTGETAFFSYLPRLLADLLLNYFLLPLTGAVFGLFFANFTNRLIAYLLLVLITLLGSPPVILLDEPTSGLDPEERIRFKNIIASLEDAHTILISTHIVEDVEALCDQVLIMNEGKIVNAGTCAEIQACARGKVYELEETDENLLKEPFSVQHRIDRNGKKMIRILSGVAQNGGSIKETEPGVEDGYICTLKNI